MESNWEPRNKFSLQSVYFQQGSPYNSVRKAQSFQQIVLRKLGCCSIVKSNCCCSIVKTLCDPMNCCTPGFPVLHCLPEFARLSHVHWISDVIRPCHPLLSPSPPAFSLSQHQGLFQWVSSSHQMAKVLEFKLWISLQSKGLWRIFSNTTVQKHQFSSTQLSL